ncbi:MAG: hypothetical protein J5379_06360 [Clostridiales bacterium]|nr:hypothetical protein [Clostridiales bacterium]
MNRERVERTVKRAGSAVLAGILSMTLLPLIRGNGEVLAGGSSSRDVDNTRLGTTGIAKPAPPVSKDDPWQGSFVWFGAYDGEPIRYRVLDPNTTRFGSETMFLDCDTVLYYDLFDADYRANTGASAVNQWEFSDVKNGLNGEKFLNRENGFSEPEKKAIASSYLEGGKAYPAGSDNEKNYGKTVGLTGEKVFLLDAEDVANPDYGYSVNYGWVTKTTPDGQPYTAMQTVVNREKDYPACDSNIDYFWWLRTARKDSEYNVGAVGELGNQYGMLVNSKNYPGVSPAMNILQSEVLFSTAVEGYYGGLGTEYKLTVIDDGIKTFCDMLPGWNVQGNQLTVPFRYDQEKVYCYVKFGIFITDKPYTEDGAQIFYLLEDSDFGFDDETMIQYFTLPSDFDYTQWGKDYHVYVYAATTNGDNETDYATRPYELTIPKASITKAEPTDNGVQIKWGTVPFFSNFNVYRSDSKNGTYTYLASVTNGSYKYVDKTAQGGKTYYYKVRPYTKSGGTTTHGSWSDAKKVTVLQDTKLTAEPKSGVTMKLSWTAVSGAGSYEIYRSTSASGPYTYVKATTGTSTSDTGLKAGTRYYYMIRAKKTANGETSYSKYASAVAVALATPTMESATFKSGKGVTLTWTKASGADRYNVYKYNTSTGKYDYVASALGGTLTYTDPNGKKGDYYKVRAYKRVDGVVYYGGWSNAKAGK